MGFNKSSAKGKVLAIQAYLKKQERNQIDFAIKAIRRDKEGWYIMIKGSIQEEEIAIINIYALNTGAPQ